MILDIAEEGHGGDKSSFRAIEGEVANYVGEARGVDCKFPDHALPLQPLDTLFCGYESGEGFRVE